MLGRRRINSSTHFALPFPTPLSRGGTRVGGANALRAVTEVVKWPSSERLGNERGLIWPLEERTGKWSEPLRAAESRPVALVAVGRRRARARWLPAAVVARRSRRSRPRLDRGAPATSATPKEAPAQATRSSTEQPLTSRPKASAGAKDNNETSTAKAPEEAAKADTARRRLERATTSSAGAATAAKVVPPGQPRPGSGASLPALSFSMRPAAATPRSARLSPRRQRPAHSFTCWRRPPRLPANVKVPRAKVLNLVPGPSTAIPTRSASRWLRVGVTSELRMDMQRDKKTGEWRVTDVLG